MLSTLVCFRAGDAHLDMLDKITRAHRRNRADLLRLLIEREAERVEHARPGERADALAPERLA